MKKENSKAFLKKKFKKYLMLETDSVNFRHQQLDSSWIIRDGRKDVTLTKIWPFSFLSMCWIFLGQLLSGDNWETSNHYFVSEMLSF